MCDTPNGPSQRVENGGNREERELLRRTGKCDQPQIVAPVATAPALYGVVGIVAKCLRGRELPSVPYAATE